MTSEKVASDKPPFSKVPLSGLVEASVTLQVPNIRKQMPEEDEVFDTGVLE